MRRDRAALIIVLIVVGVVLGAAAWTLSGNFLRRTTMYIGDGVFTTEVATTESQLQRGLSGRDNLPQNQAMLFVFGSEGRWDIWMKDMRFSIDVVWLDAAKKVADIDSGVSPDSYPATFNPGKPALYAVEFAAGTVKAKNIRIGQQARFELPR